MGLKLQALSITEIKRIIIIIYESAFLPKLLLAYGGRTTAGVTPRRLMPQ